MRQLPGWVEEGCDSAEAIAEAVRQSPSTADMIAHLSGATKGLQVLVEQHLKTFEPYAFLWLKDLASEYAAFIATKPDLEVRSCLLIAPAELLKH